MNETLTRALSGAVYILLLFTCLRYSYTSFYILFGLFLAIAVLEFCKLIKLNFVVPLLLSIGIYLAFYDSKFNIIIDTVVIYSCITISFYLIYKLFSKKEKKIKPIEKWLFIIGYIILPFILITKIPIGIKGYNYEIILGIFILIWTNDTFAYIVGKSIGKHKLFERISPKKTIEGFVGGLIFAVITAYCIAIFFIKAPSSLFIWIIFALIVSVFGTLGDLIESKFKRLAGVKDSGAIMPGHGGILDRLDSVIFVAPFIVLFYQILNYVS